MPEGDSLHRAAARLAPILVGKRVRALSLVRRSDAEALRRLSLCQELRLGEALLDQSAVAGIGNVWKSELCFNLKRQGPLPVYERAGQACYDCGTRIEMQRERSSGRSTYFGPQYQPSRRVS